VSWDVFSAVRSVKGLRLRPNVLSRSVVGMLCTLPGVSPAPQAPQNVTSATGQRTLHTCMVMHGDQLAFISCVRMAAPWRPLDKRCRALVRRRSASSTYACTIDLRTGCRANRVKNQAGAGQQTHGASQHATAKVPCCTSTYLCAAQSQAPATDQGNRRSAAAVSDDPVGMGVADYLMS
jgi:hypothetical protein